MNLCIIQPHWGSLESKLLAKREGGKAGDANALSAAIIPATDTDTRIIRRSVRTGALSRCNEMQERGPADQRVESGSAIRINKFRARLMIALMRPPTVGPAVGQITAGFN
jgi:hypothetical protein